MGKSIKKWVRILFWVLFAGVIWADGQCVKAQAASVQYRSHVQAVGWQGYVKDGTMSGTVGKSYAMEAIKIKLQGVSGGINYQSHLQNVGWTSWVGNDAQSGTTGQSRAMEAIQRKLVRKGESFATGGAAYMDFADTMGSPVPAGCKFSAKTNDNVWYGYHDINRGFSDATPVYANRSSKKVGQSQ